jgi:hypothetical protein
VEPDQHAAALVRRIISKPDAGADHLRENGRDAEALITSMLWPTPRDSLATGRSFYAVMADVRRNQNLLRAVAARVAAREYDPPSGE